jgi:hypothetical protein
MGELGFSRVWGKQFRYIYPLNKKARKYLKQSTCDWSLPYPKGDDLQWKVKRPGEDGYTVTNDIPYYNGSSVNHNSSNVNKVADKWGTATLDEFFG